MSKYHHFLVSAGTAALVMLLNNTSADSVSNLSHHIKMTCHVNGNAEKESHLTMKWGHTDFNENMYVGFPWVVSSGTEQTKEFDISDDNTEFEIQTEGGHATGYSLLIAVDGKDAIVCKFNAAPNGATEYRNKGVVHTIRSGKLDKYGCGNVRVLFNAKPNPGPIPNK